MTAHGPSAQDVRANTRALHDLKTSIDKHNKLLEALVTNTTAIGRMMKEEQPNNGN
jgi:hypothetical protein